MLLQIKIYLVATLYMFGALFMMLFPPRNYLPSGLHNITLRSSSDMLKYDKYLNPSSLKIATNELSYTSMELVKIVRLMPTTAEKNTILALELKRDRHLKKPGILVLGALNGMAWASPNAIIELADRLIYDLNYQTPFFNDYDWYLIPMGNPDGVNFTQALASRPPIAVNEWCKNKTARQTTRPSHWYKNVDYDKKQGKEHGCFGTNINRNFAYHWQDDVHSTPNRCSQYYAGIKPFSTSEAEAIRRYVDRLGSTIQLAIYLHASYIPKKEYILYPWRFSLRQPHNYKILQDLGEYAARKAKLADGRLYEVHQGSDNSRVAGSFSDYMCGVVGIDLVFIIKPYHHIYPKLNNIKPLDEYVTKSLNTIKALVRAWRSNTKDDTLWFFGKEVEF